MAEPFFEKRKKNTTGLPSMTEITAVVSVRIADITRLTHIFGEESTQQALTQFGEEATALLKRLLDQHEVIDRYRSDVDGHCSACFRVLSGGLPRDASEAAQAIEKAGRHLIRERLPAIFWRRDRRPDQLRSVGVGFAFRSSLGRCQSMLASMDERSIEVPNQKTKAEDRRFLLSGNSFSVRSG
ncbi:hypothetical protein [Paraburkholderia sp. MM5477-R1]|uniref:hypothetical protein n=1 Tax=Paraburkholderia sp. MM5477-R1 TaxID=2991062 RepID=UPI003D2070D2